MNRPLSISIQGETICFTPQDGTLKITVASEGLYPVIASLTGDDVSAVKSALEKNKSIIVENQSDEELPNAARASYTTFHPASRTIMLEYSSFSKRLTFSDSQWQEIFAFEEVASV